MAHSTHLTLSKRIRREVRARRIAIKALPLSCFAAERIAAIRRQYLGALDDADGMDCPEEAEAALGQTRRAHLALRPAWIRAQTENPAA
jgi:hypothetical protein